MNKVLKSVLGWVAYFAVLVISIYGIPKGLSYYLNTPYPMAAITSGSMWPVLKTGDLVLIKGIKNKEDVKLGDIVVYENEAGFTIHRVAKISDSTVITKGDANSISDPPVRYEEIIGKTINFNSKPLRIPMLGNIGILVNNKKI